MAGITWRLRLFSSLLLSIQHDRTLRKLKEKKKLAISVEHENITKNAMPRAGTDFYSEKEALELCGCNAVGDISEAQPQWLNG